MKARTGTAIAMLLTCALVFQGCAEDTSCVNRLIPCLNYLNGTGQDPPASCCDPLRSVIESNPDCLCSLISREGSNRAEQAGIDIDEAQLLPGRCGEHVNPLSCLANAGSRANVAPAAAVSSTLQVMMMTFLSIIVQFLWAQNSPNDYRPISLSIVE